MSSLLCVLLNRLLVAVCDCDGDLVEACLKVDSSPASSFVPLDPFK